MAIRLEDEYPTRSTPADTDYPHGSGKNKVSPTDLGTPVEKGWLNDIYGFLQALLETAGITPSGVPDTVLASDYLAAADKLYGRTFHGRVGVDGVAIRLPAGWSTVRISEGHHRITHNLGTANYTVVPCCVSTIGGIAIAALIAGNSFDVYTSTGALDDVMFNFNVTLD